jgi:SNF2 family DNA or RNA helicase
MDPLLYKYILALKQATTIKLDIPEFKGTLEDYQKIGVAYIVLAKKCMCLDFVGAGKTVQTIAADVKLRSLGEVKKTLVVCNSGKRRDWKEEYERFSDIPVTVIEGDRQDREKLWYSSRNVDGVTVVNYELIRLDILKRTKVEYCKKALYEPAELLQDLEFDFIVFDEASVFKSWGTVLELALAHLIAKVQPKVCLALSATVIQKSLEDLHSIMDKVVPGLLGSREDFLENFCVQREFVKVVPGSSRPYKFKKIVAYRNEATLAQIIQPYYIRREKTQVIHTQQKHIFKLRRVDLTPLQKKYYTQLSQDKVEGSWASMVARIGEMERVCDSVSFVDPNKQDSAKLDDLMHLLSNELNEEKVVVFSKYTTMLNQIKQALREACIGFISYTGDDSRKKREDDRRRFLEDDRIRVACISTLYDICRSRMEPG